MRLFQCWDKSVWRQFAHLLACLQIHESSAKLVCVERFYALRTRCRARLQAMIRTPPLCTINARRLSVDGFSAALARQCLILRTSALRIYHCKKCRFQIFFCRTLFPCISHHSEEVIPEVMEFCQCDAMRPGSPQCLSDGVVSRS